MATEDSLKELDDWLARQKESYELGYISAKQLYEAEMDHAAGIRGYTAQLKQSIGQLGTSTKDTISTMSKGRDSTEAWSKTVESGADAVASYTSKFGPAGKAMGLLAKSIAALNTAALAQSKALFDQYQKLSQVGVVGGKAMDEVYEKMRQFGYTQDQLGNLNQVLTENSKTLGKFYGSALEGSRVMGRAAAGFAEQRESMRLMGLTVDDLNEGLGAYMREQGALGKLRGKSDKELAEGTISYLKELDAVTKLTGLNRKEQEDLRQQALNIEAFYATLQDLDPAAAKEALKAYELAVVQVGPKMAAELAGSFDGVITGGTDMMMATGGESMKKFSKEFFEAGGTASQSMKALGDSITPQTVEAIKGINKLGGAFGPNLKTVTEFKESVKTLTEDTEKVTTEQKNQLDGLDSATKSQAAIAENQVKTAQRTADFTNIFVPAATKIQKWATDTAEFTSRIIPGSSTGGIFGLGSRGSGASGGGGGGGSAPAGGGGGTGAPAAPAAPGSRGGSSGTPTAPGASSSSSSAPPSGQGADAGSYSRSGGGLGAPPSMQQASTGGMSDDDIKKMIIRHEGIRNKPYKDSLGLWTVGVGHLIGDGKTLPPEWNREFSNDEIMKMFNDDYASHRLAAQRIPSFDKLNTKGQGALTDLTFNMGPSWIDKWPMLKKQLASNDVAAAAANLEGSKWYGQVGSRAPEVVDLLRNGAATAEGGAAFSGPKSGYSAVLHGDEAVIPLNNNSGNFIKMFETMASTNQRIVSLLEETLDVQSSIASATKNTADSSGKMLHYAQG
jgi:lysozyme